MAFWSFSSLWAWCLRLLLWHMVFGQVFTINSIHGIRYFEKVTHINRQSRIKRSNVAGVDVVEYASFMAFNRSFDMILKPGTDVLAQGFEARVIRANGRASRLYVNVNHHFTGHLLGDPEVAVDAHMEDTMMALTIFDYHDIFALEPARIYRKDSHGHKDRSWIVYRFSDTYLNGVGMGVNRKDYVSYNESFCGNGKGGMPDREAYQDFLDSDFKKKFFKKRWSGKRMRRNFRSDNANNTCSIMFVASYDLYVDRCQKSAFTCAQILISNIHFTDLMWRMSDFGEYSGFRLNIKEMMIFQIPTPDDEYVQKYLLHYNAHKEIWGFEDLLESFMISMHGLTRKFCVVFLMNAHRVSSNVLGLAHIGATCTRTNTGFATSRSDDSIISSIRNRMLFAHGHLIGATHDTDIPKCSSPSNKGGNYLMWPYVSEGYCANCQKLSICSRKLIIRFLNRPYARHCFLPYRAAERICGNGILELGEQCDEGFFENDRISCCTHKCQLKQGAVCSDHNDACCDNCQLAPKGHVCRGHVKGSCLQAAQCSGDSLECPDPDASPEGSPCKDNGFCFEGRCMTHCFQKSKMTETMYIPCMCSQDEISGCKVCCYNAVDLIKPGPCVPDGNLTLQDGTPCYKGHCMRGYCKLAVQKASKIYDLISGFDVTKGAMFMRQNIVNTVIVLSLVVWIPSCWAISEIDKRMREFYDDEESLLESDMSLAQLSSRPRSLAQPSSHPKESTIIQIAPVAIPITRDASRIRPKTVQFKEEFKEASQTSIE